MQTRIEHQRKYFGLGRKKQPSFDSRKRKNPCSASKTQNEEGNGVIPISKGNRTGEVSSWVLREKTQRKWRPAGTCHLRRTEICKGVRDEREDIKHEKILKRRGTFPTENSDGSKKEGVSIRETGGSCFISQQTTRKKDIPLPTVEPEPSSRVLGKTSHSWL